MEKSFYNQLLETNPKVAKEVKEEWDKTIQWIEETDKKMNEEIVSK